MGLPPARRKSKSRIAAILAGLYLLLVFAALAVLLLAGKDDSLAGIYFILITFPWTVGLTKITAAFHVDSTAFNTIFLSIGGIINGFIIYSVTAFLSRKFPGRG